ncbi:MAG: tetratricopeptide repeat protein [Deltaproteobacteria bacterium]|nr:tetratricopeptide repeat protein [Deltaproteobacteria bacterium]
MTALKRREEMPGDGNHGVFFSITRTGLLILMLFGLGGFLSSCQTVEKEVKVEPPREGPKEQNWASVIKDWEDYMRLTERDENFSLNAVLRFTDMYLDAKDSMYKKDTEAYERDIILYHSGRMDREPAAPQRDYSGLIRHFRRLSKRFKDMKGADALRYGLGYALYEQGERMEAAEVFEDIIKNYPRSPYIVEVNFKLGEFYFDTGQMAEAMEAYTRILEYPYSGFYEKALYKLGWVYYKNDNLEKAVSAFAEVADMHWDEKGMEGLGEEALAGVVMSLNHFNETDRALEYFGAKGVKGYAPVVYKRLAGFLIAEAKYDVAIRVFNAYNAVMKTLPEAKEPTLASDQRVDLDAGISVFRTQHENGKKTSSTKEILGAIEGYRTLLFLSEQGYPKRAVINLLLAEALFDAGMYADAAVEYTRTAMLYPAGRERGEIAYSAFLSYEVLFYQSEKGRDENLKSAEATLVAFRADLAASAGIEEVLYKLSDMYAQIKAFDMARQIVAPLFEGKGAAAAHKKTAEFYIAEGNFKAAEETYAKVVALEDEPSSREMLAKLRYRVAEEDLRAGRYEDAVKKLDEAAVAAPGSKASESALIKLGNVYIEKKDTDKLESLVKRLLKAYPGSDGAVVLLVDAGRSIEKEAPAKAAAFYEQASSLAKKADDPMKLLYAAGLLYEKSGGYDRAEEAFRRYLSGSKDIAQDKEAEVLYRIGGIQVKRGDRRAGLKTLGALLERFPRAKGFSITGARLFLVNERLDGYMKVELTQPFEETMQHKTELLDGLIAEYSGLVDENIPELLPEIFFSMGTAFENFRDAVLRSERPSDMTEDELREYNFLIEETAYPYEDRAVGAYTSGMKTGLSQKLFDEWVDKSLERLAILRPALYKRQFEEDNAIPVFLHEPGGDSQPRQASGGGA